MAYNCDLRRAINPFNVLFLFRNIQFTTAITLGLYTLLLHLPALTGHAAPPAEMVDPGMVYADLFGELAKHPFWSACAAAVLVFIQALMTNRLADKYRLMSDRNWLPGMGFVLVSALLPDFQFLSPPLVGSLFTIISLDRVFETYKSSKSPVLVFDAALWTTVASLFYPPLLLLNVAFYFGIGLMRSWSARDSMVYLAGMFTPLFLAWTWYFWSDTGSLFRSRHIAAAFSHFCLPDAADPMLGWKAAVLIFLTFVFLVNYGGISSNKSMHTQKCVSVLYWVIFIAAGSLFLQNNWHWETFFPAAAPAGIFLALTWLGMRRLFAEILQVVLLLAAFGLAFLS